MEWWIVGEKRPPYSTEEQRGSGVMFWAWKTRRELVDHFTVCGSVKMTSEKYVEFLTNSFLPWYRKNNHVFHKNDVMHDNASSPAAKDSSASLTAMGRKGENVILP